MKLTIHTDGGARGNPGPAAVGAVIEDSKNILAEISERIGESTNNFAEYTAVIKTLELLNTLKSTGKLGSEKPEINFFLDSTLVVNQLNGLFKIKENTLRNLFLKVRILEEQVGGVITYSYVPRERNHHADLLVNQALDRN